MPVLCRGRVVRTNVLLGWRPSLHKLRPATGVVVVFVCFIGTSPPSYSSPPFMPDVRLSPSPAGLLILRAVSDEVSRFSCMQFHQRAWGLRLRGITRRLAKYRRRVCSLPLLSTGSASQKAFTKLNTQPTDTSCLRFETDLAIRSARLEARWFATPFL